MPSPKKLAANYPSFGGRLGISIDATPDSVRRECVPIEFHMFAPSKNGLKPCPDELWNLSDRLRLSFPLLQG